MTDAPAPRHPWITAKRESYAAVTAMVADPILIERPILVHGSAAAIGRPPENVRHMLAPAAR